MTDLERKVADAITGERKRLSTVDRKSLTKPFNWHLACVAIEAVRAYDDEHKHLDVV